MRRNDRPTHWQKLQQSLLVPVKEGVLELPADLYEPFGKFYCYSSEQRGSASLKNVLPALTGISYDDMEISNGELAGKRYLNITFLKGEATPDKALTDKTRKDLLDYCGLGEIIITF